MVLAELVEDVLMVWRMSRKLGVKMVAVLVATAGLAGILTITGVVASAQDADRMCATSSGIDRSLIGQLVEKAEPCPLPAFTITGPDGAPVDSAALAGKVTLVNLWATWCPPCLREMPSLDALQAKLGGADFAVVAINQDVQGLEKAQTWLNDHQLGNLTAYADPKGEAPKAFGVAGLPVTVLLDRNGAEIARLVGEAEWDSPEMIEKIKRLGKL